MAPDALARLNRIDEAVTVASLAPYAAVEGQQMAATVKIIPFAIPETLLARCSAVAQAAGPLLRLAPFRPRQAGLLQTRLPGLKESLLEKTRTAVDARLAALGCPPARELRCDHRSAAIAEGLAQLADQGAELLLISGASAIVDRRDVVPAGLVAAGGRVQALRHAGRPGQPVALGRLGETGRPSGCRVAPARPS